MVSLLTATATNYYLLNSSKIMTSAATSCDLSKRHCVCVCVFKLNRCLLFFAYFPHLILTFTVDSSKWQLKVIRIHSQRTQTHTPKLHTFWNYLFAIAIVVYIHTVSRFFRSPARFSLRRKAIWSVSDFDMNLSPEHCKRAENFQPHEKASVSAVDYFALWHIVVHCCFASASVYVCAIEQSCNQWRNYVYETRCRFWMKKWGTNAPHSWSIFILHNNIRVSIAELESKDRFICLPWFRFYRMKWLRLVLIGATKYQSSFFKGVKNIVDFVISLPRSLGSGKATHNVDIPWQIVAFSSLDCHFVNYYYI